MPPHGGLTHLKEYDIKDSNVELIGTEIDHKVKFNSAETEPAWNNGTVGQVAGLYIWRIEDFEVVVWPKEKAGQFYNGDSYIVLHSFKVGEKEGKEQLIHDIFFWLGSKTSQDEAGTAAYKTVELDEFLKGVATQHREIQQSPSDEFMALFPRIKILSGGVKSGFRHVEEDAEPKEISTLLRIFKHPGTGRADSMVVIEVDPTWQSLNDEDVFVLDKGIKIWVWQGKKCSPMEKAKAAQVVNDLTLAKHIDVEVLAQTDSRSRLVVDLLGGRDVDQTSFHAPRPVSSSKASAGSRPRKLFRLSDSSGELSFDLVKDGAPIQRADLDGNDVFLVDIGSAIWVWRGLGASKAEKAMWLNVAQSYIRRLQGGGDNDNAHLIPLASVAEGNESPAFFKAIEV
ncbi:putative actin-binding protein Fragmin [Hyaloscypha variabilis F]|uniref:Putative actin-binding protein Fragmin n=1 Tax=Hyaloscypha variabilis (strain UAMH 11265 / GT02V1 / F) TaxID=1149755 RepID=A0A2J6RZI9_HYAVF|nr:putative actin-binding protein Fragmin [Hyaloscypha variabilis F]